MKVNLLKKKQKTKNQRTYVPSHSIKYYQKKKMVKSNDEDEIKLHVLY